MSLPLVSIGLPVYNGELSIERALDSILAQDFEDFELVVSDNASADKTGALCQSYAARDRRIRYFRNASNIGVSPNHDRVFELSAGKYFMWAAHDVEYLPGMLRRCVQEMTQAPPSVVLVYPRCELMHDGRTAGMDDNASVECRDPRPYRRLQSVIHNVVMVNQLYGLMRSEALRQTRLNGSYPSSDYVLLAELAMLGEIREIPEVLTRRRLDSEHGTLAVRHNQKAWRAWLNPNEKQGLGSWLPYRERLAVEYLRGTWHVPLKPVDKFMCLLAVLPVYYGRTSSLVRFALRTTRPWRRQLRRLKPHGHASAAESRPVSGKNSTAG